MSPEANPGVEPPPVGTIVIDGKYRVERTIGRGGMGLVLEATHLALRERVAIKLLLPELIDSEEASARFRREGRILFKIENPHVCRVFDVGTTEGGSPYMVMELLEGEDLAGSLQRGDRFDVEEAVALVLQACRGIAEAHVRGILHRDLKPENLFVTRGPDGRACVKLLDFGLGKVKGDAIDTLRSRNLTGEVQVMGTPCYMAPEQWMASKDVGAAADQWSLAIILYELIAGRPPFPGEAVAEVCSLVLSAPTPDLSELRHDVPKGLAGVLHKALEKNPADRYESIGAFAVALSAFGPVGAAVEAERVLAMSKHAPAEMEESGRFSIASPPSHASDMDVTLRDGSPGLDVAVHDQQPTVPSVGGDGTTDPRLSRLAIAMAAVTLGLLGVVAMTMWGGERRTPPTRGASSPVAAPGDRAPSAAPTAVPTAAASATAGLGPDRSAADSAAPVVSAAASAPRSDRPRQVRAPSTRRPAPPPSPEVPADAFDFR